MHRYTVKITHSSVLKAEDADDALELAMRELNELYDNGELEDSDSVKIKKLTADSEEDEEEETEL